jgi:hypothetical protein
VFAFVSKDGYDTDFFAKSSTVLTIEKCEANTTLADVQLKMASDVAQASIATRKAQKGVLVPQVSVQAVFLPS